MQVDQFLRAVRHGVTDGSKFCWDCYGSSAWYLDADGVSAVIDQDTGKVYELSIYGDANYRWIDPDHVEKYLEESASRGCNPWQAYDDVMFVRILDANEAIGLIRN